MKLKPKDKKQLKLLELIAEKVKSTIYNGHVFVTGEYVRDCIIGRKNSTINIVVDVQNGGIGLASWLSHVILKDCSAQDINEEGISSMVVDGIKFEFSQTVHNKNNDFGCLSDDALTRNFTVNALYYDICADEFIDPTEKAFSDIENGILRSCQDPITAFDDKPIDILVGIKLSALLSWSFSKETWVGMVLSGKRISWLSGKELRKELDEILVLPKPSICFDKMIACGVLKDIIPEIDNSRLYYQSTHSNMTMYEHLMSALDKTKPLLINRLAILLHDLYKLYSEDSYSKYYSNSECSANKAMVVLGILGYSWDTIDDVRDIIKCHKMFDEYNNKQLPPDDVINKFLDSLHNDETLIDATLDVINANITSQPLTKRIKLIPKIKKKIQSRESSQQLPLNGNDILKELNIKSGPIIGLIMNEIRAEMKKNPSLTKKEAIKVAKEYIKKVV